MDTPPPNPPYNVSHPRLERRLHLIDYDEATIVAQSRKLPDFHPYNDEHTRAVVKAVEEFEQMKPYLAEIDYYVLLHLLHNVSPEKINEEYKVRIDQSVIDNSRDRPEIKEAYAILTTIRSLHEGTTRRNRADLLWRIAVRSEKKRPDLAIAAVNALNKMDLDDRTLDPSTNSGSASNRPSITLVVNNPALLRAPLDVEEARVVEATPANG